MHTIHFTVGFSSFVDAASSRQIAVVILMLTVRDLQNLILQFKFSFRSQKTKRRNKFGVNDNYILWLVAKQHN